MNLPENESNHHIDEFDIEVLRLIYSRTQKEQSSTWYNIEMRISTKPSIPRKKVLNVLDELEKIGLITRIEDKPLDKWFITEQGKKYLQNLEDKENS